MSKVFEYILERNQDQKEQNCTCQLSNSFSQPIHLVAYNGNLHILKILLENGAQVVSKNRFGDTPLHIAIRNKQRQFAKWLIQYLTKNRYSRALVEIENATEKLTPYMLAVLREDFEIASMLVQCKLAK